MVPRLRVLQLILFCLLLLPVTDVSGQVTISDSGFTTKAMHQTAALYQEMIGSQSRLNNGIQYAGYPFAFVKGHPFFGSDSLVNGSVVYDHILYNDLNLMYDELSDLLLVSLSGYRIQVSNERIAGFTIRNTSFVRLQRDSSQKATVDKDGFYQLLYPGGIGVSKREVKTILEELSSSEGTLRSILTNKTFYIRKGNGYYPANSRKAILEIFGDHKKEVRDYIKDNGLNFKNDPETVLVKASNYYEQLSN